MYGIYLASRSMAHGCVDHISIAWCPPPASPDTIPPCSTATVDCTTYKARVFTFTNLLIDAFPMHPVSPVHSTVMANLIFLSPLNFMLSTQSYVWIILILIHIVCIMPVYCTILFPHMFRYLCVIWNSA